MKKKKTLNELIADYNRIESIILENDGVVDQEIESLLEINNEEIGEKLNGYEKFIRHLKSQVQYLKDMESQYSKKRKILEKSIDTYKQSMANVLEVTGETSVKTLEFSFSLNSSEKWSVDIDSINSEVRESLISKGFAESVFKPNIKEIKNEYRNSKEVPDWISIAKNKFIKAI